MTVFERIKELSNGRKVSLSKVAIDLGFSENLFYRWKTTEPKARDLEKVADYFNVSVDYLLGREEKNNTSFASDDLNKILDNAKSFDGKPITENDKEAIRLFLEGRMSK
ncbi:helix-turn-helix domain-containing protein [Enterococcus thailandicus]|uniref:helix-turn-helix domain-containing protein n=1 Tax=Enterococcus TaxID=1350 RepID=UPI0022E3E68E|nr:helix-turn-helix transcriptional regulator [Enterococcus thailandicus]